MTTDNDELVYFRINMTVAHTTPKVSRYSKDHMSKLHVKLPKTKTCNTCNTEKPLKEFNKSSKSKDNRRNKCRECSIAYQRQYKAEHRKDTAYTIDQAKNMIDDQIELAKKKATKAYELALRKKNHLFEE